MTRLSTVGSSVAISLFFVSGAAALSYQIIWQRFLGFFAGSDAVATTIIVAGFLFGLGVGSFIGAIVADRLSARRALVLFAASELLIGLCGLATKPFLYDVVFIGLAPLSESLAATLVLVFLSLLLPTTLMGLSFPLLAKATVRDVEHAASSIGWLLGANTIGAAFGTLVCGFVLIGEFGYLTTISIAVVGNLLVAAFALAIAMRTEDEPVQRFTRWPVAALSRRREYAWALIVFASGFVIISLEIVWFRLLGVMQQSSAYAFPLMLAAFLLADALGMLVGGAMATRVGRPLRVFQTLQAAAVLYAMALAGLIYLLHTQFDLTGWFVDGFAYSAWEGRTAELVRLGVQGVPTAIVVMPPAFLLGVSVPMSHRAVHDDLGQVGRRAGVLQLANIFGNTLGAIVTGLLLLDWFGTMGTIKLLGFSGVAFIVLLSLLRQNDRGYLTLDVLGGRYVHAGILGLLALCYVVLPGNVGFWKAVHGAAGAQAEEAMVEEDHAAVAVLRPTDTGYGLYVGGHWQSDSDPFPLNQVRIGLIGPLVHPAPEDILLIGWGSGGTLHGLRLHPATERIRVVEIAEPVLRINQRVAEARPDGLANAMENDPRIEPVLRDGRHLLFTTTERHDIIVAETVPPRGSRSNDLFSVEFFQQARAHLKEGGMMVQWRATDRTVHTFLAVFPHVTQIGNVLIGSERALALTREELLAKMTPAVAEHLRAAGIDPITLNEYHMSATFQQWGPGAPRQDSEINTDLRPRDEYYLN
ncbi:MAG: fused MFS/spermidine synthase [Geminicoccaceae bacterium]